MSLMGLVLWGGYLVCFARFCDTFRDVLTRAERCGRPEFADAEGFRSLQRFFGEVDDFSDIFLHCDYPPED